MPMLCLIVSDLSLAVLFILYGHNEWRRPFLTDLTFYHGFLASLSLRFNSIYPIPMII